MPRTGADRDLQWVTISDFTAGIEDGDPHSLLTSASAPWVPYPLFKPVASKPTRPPCTVNTYSCIALPQGGLTPLPGLSRLDAMPTVASVTYPLWVTGEIDMPYDAGTPGAAICLDLQGFNSTPKGFHEVFKQTSNSGAWSSVDTSTVASTPTAWGSVDSPSAAFFSAGITGNAFIEEIIWAANWLIEQVGAVRQFSILHATTASLLTSPAIPLYNQGRVIFFTLGDASYNSISFTDPPLTTTVNAAKTLVNPLTPCNIASYGILSTGELLLLTNGGGGIIITGDIFSPTATQVPGVRGTNGLYGPAAPTDQGLFYLVDGDGLYSWSGDATSRKISPQLRGDFYNRSGKMMMVGGTLLNQSCGVGDQTSGHPFSCRQRGDWVLIQDGWLYSLETTSFWRFFNYNPLPASAPQSCMYYGWRNSPQVFYGFPFIQNSTGEHSIINFNFDQPSSSYQWQSHPIAVSPVPNHYVEIGEIALLLDGSCSYIINLSTPTNPTGVTVTGVSTYASGKPTVVRNRVPNMATDILILTVQITNTSTGGVPSNYPTTLHAISLGIRDRFPVVTQ